ncbi:TPA: hypothetical protein EYP66_07135 [Candidatus Poribacteria bacterium]|nr:hypothetical protein [Candidatus Poribacteria bacterium]
MLSQFSDEPRKIFILDRIQYDMIFFCKKPVSLKKTGFCEEETMNYTPTEEHLIEAMERMEIVDAHEHLPPESSRTNAEVDVLTLFSHYTRTDLITAGMKPEEYDRMFDQSIALSERWKLFRPHLENIRYGSYARPAFIAAKEFYGYDDINDDTYEAISGRMAAANTPGIYDRVIREKCNIKVCLTQAGRTDFDRNYLIPLMPLDIYGSVSSAEEVTKKADDLQMQVSHLDDYLELANRGVNKWKSEGAVGLKMSTRPSTSPDQKAAEEQFSKLLSGEKADMRTINNFLMHKMLDIAAELDMVVAVHTGMWGDFRTLDPKFMISIVPQHPETRFDIYHLGMPWVRETAVIGKNFPNVWLNFCWCHIISPKMTCSVLDEVIDLVPMNKILGFGGDYSKPVEKIYGHLVMAREDIATVLGGRIDRGLMNMDEAVCIAQKWLVDNPRELYKLDM